MIQVHSDRWPKWACRRAPAERRGHCSDAGGLSAGLQDPLYRNRRHRVFRAQFSQQRILDLLQPAFLSLAATSASSPHQSLPGRSDARFRRGSADIVRCARLAGDMSVLPIVLDRHDGQDSGRRQLLALHKMRRGLECDAFRDRFAPRTSMAVRPPHAVRDLLELTAALARRVPRVERAGELERDAGAFSRSS
jgi:hypothetical protein